MSSVIVVIAGHELDLAAALPLKVRDWKQLDKAGITPETLRSAETLTIAVSSAFVSHIVAKANSAVTQEMIDDLTLTELTEILMKIGEVQQRIDRPTSPSSTSSPASTGGDPATSTT
jgi:hypothetical protein